MQGSNAGRSNEGGAGILIIAVFLLLLCFTLFAFSGRGNHTPGQDGPPVTNGLGFDYRPGVGGAG